ncbi:DUF554 domain-containing protein [Streptococcus suis]|uniref:DUF554 domain-containing protein n=1 Tax=Streptococcus suis TaxID=1307 RepID=UPI002876F06A|nr:DUF554 domain-containing protein [Streptococcus suis]MDS1160652.1 DUF554 domain-containing protein [Streptococcus suis]HEL2533206.1 DUF554 domain-containing protein [Streptococcus suis]
MFALGTIINTVAIALAGLLGAGHLLKERHQSGLTVASGLAVLFLGISGSLEGLLTVVDGQLKSQNSMLLVLSLALGTLIGEVLHIEGWFERLGVWLREKSGNSQDGQFLDAFLTASLTVCIGAMAILGAIQDGLTGDYRLLAVKSILDFIIILIMTSSLGKGAGFSAVPVFLFQGSVTLLARLIEPLMTDQALANLSFIGSALIFCVGVNIIWDKKIRVANMLPAIVIAVIWSYFT